MFPPSGKVLSTRDRDIFLKSTHRTRQTNAASFVSVMNHAQRVHKTKQTSKIMFVRKGDFKCS